MVRREKDLNAEIRNIWKALKNLDKADVQTAALCHAIVTMLIEKGIGSQEEIAEGMEKSIPQVVAIRKEVEDAISDRHPEFKGPGKKETIH